LLLAGLGLCIPILGAVKDPVIDQYTRVTYQGAWTVIENNKTQTVSVYNQYGDLFNACSLVGKGKGWLWTTVDLRGNCLVNRGGKEEFTTALFYFNTTGKEVWNKETESLQGAFVLSPNGEFFVRGMGPVSRFETFKTSSPNEPLSNPSFDGVPPATSFHADVASDNTIIVFVSPRTLYKIDPSTGKILATSGLTVPSANSIRGATGDWGNDHCSNRYRTLFMDFVWKIGTKGTSLLVYDQSLQFQRLIEVGAYIQSISFVDSQMVAFTTLDKESNKFKRCIVKDFNTIEVADFATSDRLGVVASDETSVYFFTSQENGSTHYDHTSKRNMEKSFKELPLFKKKNNKERKAISIIK
jgi:hypothetical protein